MKETFVYGRKGRVCFVSRILYHYLRDSNLYHSITVNGINILRQDHYYITTHRTITTVGAAGRFRLIRSTRQLYCCKYNF